MALVLGTKQTIPKTAGAGGLTPKQKHPASRNTESCAHAISRLKLRTSYGRIDRASLDFPLHLRSRNLLLGPARPFPARIKGFAHLSLPILAERKRRDRQPDNPEFQSGGKATPQSMLQSFASMRIRDSVTRYERSYR